MTEKFRVVVPAEIGGVAEQMQWIAGFATADIWAIVENGALIVTANAGTFDCPFAELIKDEA